MFWHVLEPILLREGFARDAPHFVEPLRQAAEAADPPARDRALAACAAALGGNGHAARFLGVLAGSEEPDARHLALELAARLPALPDPALVPALRALLRDRRLPPAVRLAAAVALVRTTGPTGKATQRVLRDFAVGFGRMRFLDRLPALRERFGPLPALDRYTARLRERLPLRCPRCGVKQRRPAMVRHLWRRHRLLLDGRRVRSLWGMLGRWLDGPADGRLHADRELLRHGLRDPALVADLQRDAAGRRAALCPNCYAVVPLDPAEFPVADAVRPLNLAVTRLSGHGFAVDVSERGLTPRLRAETPRGIVSDGPEPGRRFTPHGRRWLGVGVPVLLALALAVLLPSPLALLGTVLALLVAADVGLGLRARRPPDPTGRMVDHAWRLLAPQAHAGGVAADDAAFIAALADLSQGRGDARARERVLQQLVECTTAAVQAGQATLAVLAPLLRLRAADAAATGGDPVRVLAEAVGPCFTGERSPGWADVLLTAEILEPWTRGQLARLRALLAARAFASGMGVWELHELGRAVPGLGRVFDPDDTDGLARLRLLWDLRPIRPWQHCGPAATVFELAHYPMLGGQHLETAPDLLLFQPLPAGREGKPESLLVCGRGLILHDAIIHERPQGIDVKPLPNSQGGGYALHIGPHEIQFFPDNPDALVYRLGNWADFFFNQFLPRIADVLARPAGPGLKRLLRRVTVRCPECGTRFLARRSPVE
jgi:hypothetical protein